MANEFNNLGNDEQVADMLGTLNRVEAPSDFEMKVRSRIARSAPRTRFGRAELLLGLKFAIPALVLAAFGVFLAFSNLTEVNRSAVPPVEDFAPAATQPIVNPSNPQNNIRPAVNNSILARTSDGNTVNSGAKEKNTEPAGGSKDEALSPAGETIYPLGLDPNRKVEDLRGVSGDGAKVREILSMIGIAADCGKAGCKVTGVSSNSMADHSGILTGDMIEALDDKPVNADTEFKGSISVKSLRVLRDGKRLTIVLKTN